MSDLISPWETFRAPVTAEDPHFVDCRPDLYVPELLDLTADAIVALGVEHVFIDFDGTVAVNNNNPPVTERMFAHLGQLAADPRFKSFDIATDNRAPYMLTVAEAIGPRVKVFQPNETPKGPIMKFHTGFWRRLLFETDIWDTPERAAMVGDSPRYDIAQAQAHGMKTILVDRLEKRMAPNLAERLAELRARRTSED